jgi:hypothetical protein
MLKKISLAFALVTALVALPALGGMALAQGGFPQWGECTTNYYGHGPCWGSSVAHLLSAHVAGSGQVIKPAPFRVNLISWFRYWATSLRGARE